MIEKNTIYNMVKQVADNKTNKVDSKIGIFLSALIKEQEVSNYKLITQFQKDYEKKYKATMK
tara:strand:- start:825 stop:1010 length:186 start_codon:yes stop_codon:yes gene_type:complete